MSALVRNPEDRFSHNKAHNIPTVNILNLQCLDSFKVGCTCNHLNLNKKISPQSLVNINPDQTALQKSSWRSDLGLHCLSGSKCYLYWEKPPWCSG